MEQFPSLPSTTTPPYSGQPPQSTLSFNGLVVGLSADLVGGVFVDGWAHTHDKVDTSFSPPGMPSSMPATWPWQSVWSCAWYATSAVAIPGEWPGQQAMAWRYWEL
jgi:hypothetical protein